MKTKEETEQEIEERGIKAIIALQGLANVEESRDQARAGWRSMGDGAKQTTLKTYEMIFGEESN